MNRDVTYTDGIQDTVLTTLLRRIDQRLSLLVRNGQPFTSLALGPVDYRDFLLAVREDEVGVGRTERRDLTVFGLTLHRGTDILPGWAALRSPGGDEWRFRWDPRFRCGGCGVVLPNEEEQDAALLTPYCPTCARLKRPGMYAARGAE